MGSIIIYNYYDIVKEENSTSKKIIIENFIELLSKELEKNNISVKTKPSVWSYIKSIIFKKDTIFIFKLNEGPSKTSGVEIIIPKLNTASFNESHISGDLIKEISDILNIKNKGIKIKPSLNGIIDWKDQNKDVIIVSLFYYSNKLDYFKYRKNKIKLIENIAKYVKERIQSW